MGKRVQMGKPADIEAAQRSRLLDDLREIVSNQVNLLKNCSATAVYSPAMAQTLASVVRTYRALESDTEQDAEKYNLTGLSESQLMALGRGEGTE